MGTPPFTKKDDKKNENPSSSKSVDGTPIVIFLVLIAVGVSLFLIFKDKIFKKKKSSSTDLKDLATDPEPEPEQPITPEPLDPDSEESQNVIERMESIINE